MHVYSIVHVNPEEVTEERHNKVPSQSSLDLESCTKSERRAEEEQKKKGEKAHSTLLL